MTFTDYVMSRKRTDSVAGDFTDDAKHDIRMGKFRDFQSWDDLHSYLIFRGACAGAMQGAYQVWRQYLKFRDRPAM